MTEGLAQEAGLRTANVPDERAIPHMAPIVVARTVIEVQSMGVEQRVGGRIRAVLVIGDEDFRSLIHVARPGVVRRQLNAADRSRSKFAANLDLQSVVVGCSSASSNAARAKGGE